MKKGTPDEIDKFVGEKLREARNEAAISQESAAKRIGLSFQQIQKYEKGLNRVSASRLAKLSKLYEKPIVWFFPHEYQGGTSEYITQLENKITALKEHLEAIERAVKGAKE